MLDQIRQELLKWFETNGRKFLWRTHSDPYVVLMAEVLLKKTTAGAVDNFLPVFLERYPGIHAIYEESCVSLQKLLAPLGLSNQRATQLKNLARVLVELHGGEVPCNKEELLKLPGVGDYTASAVLCFACGIPEAIVDTNIARLVVRLFGVRPSRYEPRRSPEVWEKATELVCQDGGQSKRVNWALLDLAAAVCKPRNPLHSRCPITRWCVFARTGPDGNQPHTRQILAEAST